MGKWEVHWLPIPGIKGSFPRGKEKAFIELCCSPLTHLWLHSRQKKCAHNHLQHHKNRVYWASESLLGFLAFGLFYICSCFSKLWRCLGAFSSNFSWLDDSTLFSSLRVGVAIIELSRYCWTPTSICPAQHGQ